MAMRVEDGINFAGDFFIFFGVGSMVCLSIAAWVLLIILLSSKNNHSHAGPTLIIFPSYCGYHDPYYDRHYGYGYYALVDMAFFVVMGLIVSAIVVGLALNMGLPSIALGLGVGWCGAFSMILAGLFMRSIGDAIKRGQDSCPSEIEDQTFVGANLLSANAI